MKAYIYFTITVICWGLNFHLAKVMLQQSHFIEAGFWRYLFGVVPLFILAYKGLPSFRVLLKNITGVLLVGVVCLFGFNFCFFLGLKYSMAINGSLIMSLAPALTLLYSNLILKTPLKPQELLGVFISLLGVIYLILKGNLYNFASFAFSWGDIILLFAANFFALQNVLSKKYGSQLSNMNFTFFTNLFCMLSFLVLFPFIIEVEVPSYSSSYWLSAIGIGGFGTALAYLLWNKGIQLTNANKAGIFLNAVPLTTAGFSLVFGEVLYGYHLISGIIILVGVFILIKK